MTTRFDKRRNAGKRKPGALSSARLFRRKLVVETLESRLLLSHVGNSPSSGLDWGDPVYAIAPIAQTDATFISLGNGPSINDAGRVAFVGQTAGEEGIYIADVLAGTIEDTSRISSTDTTIVIRSPAHGLPSLLPDGSPPRVTIRGVEGDSAANTPTGSTWIATVINANQFSINTMSAPSEYLGGGTWRLATLPNTAPVRITSPSFSGDFSGRVQITNANDIVSHVTFPAPNAITQVRVWDSDSVDESLVLAQGPSGQYAAVLGHPDLSALGNVVFSAINPSLDEILVTSANPGGQPVTTPTRPAIAKDGHVAVRVGSTSANSDIVLYAPDLMTSELIAASTDFTALGLAPGIAGDHGEIVVFYGELSEDAVAALSAANRDVVPGVLTPGPGIFASIALADGRHIIRIAGIAGNGFLDPGERLLFEDGNPDTREDAGFDYNYDGNLPTVNAQILDFVPDSLVDVSVDRRGFANVVYLALKVDKQISDASIILDSNLLVASSANTFSQTDVGKTMRVAGAGPNGSDLVTRITSLFNPTGGKSHIVELATAASHEVHDSQAWWGDEAIFSSRINFFDGSGGDPWGESDIVAIGVEAPIRVVEVDNASSDSLVLGGVNDEGEIVFWAANETGVSGIFVALPAIPPRLVGSELPSSPLVEFVRPGHPDPDGRGGVEPNQVVLHATVGGEAGALRELVQTSSKAIHYLVSRQGRITQAVAEGERARHANNPGAGGPGSNPDRQQTNIHSIGIEHVDDAVPSQPGHPEYPEAIGATGHREDPNWFTAVEAQRSALLVRDIAQRNNIFTVLADGTQVIEHPAILPFADLQGTNYQGGGRVSAAPFLDPSFSVALGPFETIYTMGGAVVGTTPGGPVLVTSVDHGLKTGMVVEISGVQGMPEANGRFTITVQDDDTFSLDGVTSAGAAGAGGTWRATGFQPGSSTSEGSRYWDGYSARARGVISHGQVADRTGGKDDPRLFDWDEVMTRVNQGIALTLTGTGNIFVRDSAGRRAGIDPVSGQVYQAGVAGAIPGSQFRINSPDHQVLTIANAYDDDYVIQVTSPNGLDFALEILASGQDATLFSEVVGLSSVEETSAQYVLDHTAIHPTQDSVSGSELAIAPDHAEAIRQGLDAATSVAGLLHDHDDLTTSLPFVGMTLEESLAFHEGFHQAVVDPIASYFDSAAVPSLQGLMEALRLLDSLVVSGVRLSPDGRALEIDTVYHARQRFADIPIELGAEAAAVGLSLDGSAMADFDAALEFSLTFGLDLTANLSADAFFLKKPRVKFTGGSDVSDIAIVGHIGALEGFVVGGTLQLEAEVIIGFEDPNGDGRLSLRELRDAPADVLAVTTEPTVSVDGVIQLPFNLNPFQIGEFTVGLSGLATVTPSDADFSLTAQVAGMLVPGLEILPGSQLTLDDESGMTIDALARAFGVDISLSGSLDAMGDFSLVADAAPFELGGLTVDLLGAMDRTAGQIDYVLTGSVQGELLPGLEILPGSIVRLGRDEGLEIDAQARAFGVNLHLTGDFDPSGNFTLIATVDDLTLGGLTIDLSGNISRTGNEFDYFLTGDIQGELVPGLAILPGSIIRLGRDEGLEINATASAFGATVHIMGDFEAGGDFSFAASTDPFEIVGAMVTLSGSVSRQAGELDWGLTGSVTDWQPAPFLTIDMLDVTLDEDGIGFETTTTIAGVNGIHLVGDYRFDDSTYALMGDVPLDWTPVSQVNLSDVRFFVTNRNTDGTAGAVRIGASAELRLFDAEFQVAARVTAMGQWLAATPASGEWNPVPIPGFSIGQPFLVASTYDFVLELPALIEVTNPPTPLDIDQRQIYAGINLLGSGVLPESIPGVGGSAIQIAGLLPADLDLAKLSIDAKLVFANPPEIAGLLALDAVGLRITGAPSIAVFGQGRVLHDQIPSLDQDIAVELALVIDIPGTTVSGSLSLLSPIPNLFGVEGLNVIEGDGEFGINFATTPLPLPTIGFNFLVELPEFAQDSLGLPSQIGASLNVSTTQPILAMNVVDWRPFEPLGIDDVVIDQGSLVVAPNGGTIGTKVFPRGFSAAFDAEIVGTDVNFVGVFDQATRGIVVKGSASGTSLAGIGVIPNGCDGLYEDGVDNSTPDWIDPDADNGVRFTATVIATAPQDNGFTVDFAVDLPGSGGLVCVHGELTNTLLVLDGTITNWTPLPTVSLAGSLHAEVGVKSQGMELGFDVHGQILGAMTHFVGAISASDAGFELFATGTIAWRFPGGGKFVDLAATIDLNRDSSFRIEVAADLRLPGSRPADVLLSGEISSSGVDVAAIVDDWQIVPGVSFEGTVDVAANIAGTQLAVNIDVDANLIGSTLNLEGQLLAGSSGFDLDLDGHVRFGGTRVGLVVLDLDASLDTTSGFVIQFDGTIQVFSGGLVVGVEAELQSSSSGWRIEVEANVDVFDFEIELGIGTVELDLDLGGRLQFGSSLSDFEFELFVDGEASIEVDDVGSSTIDIDAELKIDGDEIVIPNAKPKITYKYVAGIPIPTGFTWKDLKLPGADPSPPRVTVTAERVLVPGLPVIFPLPLQIRGGSLSEQVEVFRRLSPPNSPQPGSGNVVVRATNDVGEWVTLLDIPASRISLIDVDMRGGDDSVMIHPSIVIPTVIMGGNGSDTIQGGTGVDTIYGGSGSSGGGGGPRRRLDIATTLLEDRGDTINGGPGNDTIFGEAGNDVIGGGGGNDTIDGGTGVNIINGALQVTGTDRHDRLDVTTNVRVIKSFPGSLSLSPELSFETDVIVRSGFGAGPLVTLFRVPLDQISAIHIDAGSGNDTISVSPQIALPTVLRGGPGNDAIHAGAGPSTIFGGDGDDRIYGGPANDTIDCGPGIDTVVSSGGADVIDPASCEHLVAGPQVGTTDPGENHPPILAAIGDKTVDEGSPLTFTAFATDQGDEARFVDRNGYQSAQDSPFNGLDFSYLHLENFEDGALNTPGVTVSAGQVYPATPADLVSQWRANGTAADSAGGNDGILRGNTRFADGHLGKAFSFDGAGDYVEVPNSLSLRFREQLTLEGWIFLSDSQRTAFFQSIASKGTTLSGSAWELSVVSDLFTDRLRLRSNARLADGSTISINGDTTLKFNEWYHVAMTYNGVRLACYVNGELDGSITERSPQLLALSTGPLLIGEDLSGLIDELSVFDRALSAAEIQAIVNAGGDNDSTDSVDSDDGEVDGRGTAGRSFVIDSGDPVAFTFNANTLQGFPTHVGVVWTDSMLGTQLTLDAFDANGASLGTTVAKLRDPSLFGRTAEDRFLGVTYTAGISKIELRSSGDGPIELDHLQYGRLQGQPVRYSLDPGAPDGATINQLTGAFRWTPSEEQGPNVYSVTVRASDGGSPALSDSETFIITVNEVNDPPQMAPIPDLFVVRGQPVQFTVIASDFDLTTTAGLRFHLAGGAPAGATIDPLTGEFRWIPGVTQPLGESFVTVLVTDQGDSPLTSGVSISITVQADINPPTVTDVRLIADSRAITSIVIDVSEPLEPASARDPGHYHLVGLGPDGRLGTADDHAVPLSAAAYVAGARAIVLTPQEHLPFNEMFKLLVQPAAGAGGSPLADVFGNTLDGDANGLPGGNHEIAFARGKSLSFLDHDGDTVALTLWGSGVMELLESGAGGALNLRVLALKAGDAYLSGEVTAAAANSDGLALLNVSGLSGVENLLSDPPFVLTVNARGVPPIVTLPGDFNRDGTVDLADYVVWRKTLGASQIAFTGADGNGDEIVDAADQAVWKANFGQSIASPPPLPGDFNRDAAVDASDYVTWRKAMGTSTSAFAGADGNGNGLVDGADYVVWRTNFGNALAASASSAAHSVEPSEAPPSSGSVQVVATGQATPHAGSGQNAKASGIGQPITVSADPPTPPAILATSFEFARKIVRQPFRPATAFEAQDRGLESDLAFTLHETDRYLTRSQELLLEAVSDADREWPFESEPNGLVPLNSVDKRLSIRDELFSKWNEWHHLSI